MKKQVINLLIPALFVGGCALKPESGNRHITPIESDSVMVIIGSYCTAEEEGIKIVAFNQEDGGFTYKSGLKGVSNPSFVSDVYNDSLLYSVAEDDSDATAAACAITYDTETGRLSLLGTERTDGGAPCNVCVYPEGRKVFTANYSGGSLSVFSIGKTGRLRLDKVIKFTGSGSDKDRQTQPHIHSANVTPDGRWLWANDLGTDRIRVISLDTLEHNEKNDILLPKGCGPRHTCFGNDGRFAYLVSEMSGDVFVIDVKSGNRANIVQSIKADTVGGRGSADIHLLPDGRYLYASCRLKADGIAVFKVDSVSGMLSRVGYRLTGKHPRNFAITPNGKYMLVACRDEDAVEVYSINPDTGLLEDTGGRILMKSPVCIRFVR